jgi:hypothetical protein
MTERQISHLTRRRLLQAVTALALGGALGPSLERAKIQASSIPVSTSPSLSFSQTGSLSDAVRSICERLSGGGWRDLLLQVTDDELDITSPELPDLLSRSLLSIDRTVPGFEDFSLEGTRGIEQGSPARSLFYHALASPNVFEDGQGNPLSLFPTPAEIETVENYVYGISPPTLDKIREQAGGAPLAVVVFALEYRSARETVHGKHADLCFSRTGHSRLGNAEAHYDAQRREFLPISADDPFAFPVQPGRYAAYLAFQQHADPGSFGPLRATDEDANRLFWTPLHKLFDGPECIEGFDLSVELTTGNVNEKLRRFHQHLNNAGFYTGWDGPELERFPFVMAGDTIAAFSSDPDHGTGWVLPTPHPFTEPAVYQGRPLSFFYSEALASIAANVYFSGLQLFEIPVIDPLGPARTQTMPENHPSRFQTYPGYLTDIGPDGDRSAPEYLNIRRRVNADGSEDNLNDVPDLLDVLDEGGFWVRHFIDYSADGWVAARCTALDAAVPTRVPAFSMISPPTFYPYTNQRELTEWTETQVPEELRTGIWAIPPRPLSDRRMAANIDLPAGFSITDDTMTAIVTHPIAPNTAQSGSPETFVRRHLLLPDGAAGLFDPGWDVSQGRTDENLFFMESYGLGTPFVEDVKICSALSSFWPGVAPDGSREFQPKKMAARPEAQAWPTIAPVTDEEMGIIETAQGGFLPWDGIRGPVVTTIDGEEFVDYPDITHTDYLETFETFTAALTGTVEHEEFVARVFAMAQVYWALGIRLASFADQYEIGEALDRFQGAKAEWALLSFHSVTHDNDELGRAETTASAHLTGERIYRFQLFQWGEEQPHPDDLRRTLVAMKDQVTVYCDLTSVLIGRDLDSWELHQPPTH